MSDPAKYRSREEVQKVRQERDPIDRIKEQLLGAGGDGIDEARLKEIDKEIKAIVTDAADFAQSDGEPDASELTTDVYAAHPAATAVA
jgi:pyruvate dehydrogenase E1 component alpha subunit